MNITDKHLPAEKKSPFRQILFLTGARIFGIIFSLVIPMYLGRELTVGTYGTYKQIMLFFWFAQVALNLGIDDSAYFYLKWDPQKFSLYSFNALVFNILATGLLWLGMIFFAREISQLLNNAELTTYLPLLGYLILTTVSSMQIEGILIGKNRFNERLLVEVGMEFLKSLGIIASFYFFKSLYLVLVILSVLMTIRLLATIKIILRYKNEEGLRLKDAPQYFISQLKFGIPLGVSRILHNLLNMENFFISSFFSLAQFTYYSVGCFENPLINAARNSTYEIINIEMVDSMKHNGEEHAISVWKNMNRKLFLMIIPLVIYMMFFSREIILFIFSEKYLASVPFFVVFNLYLIVGAMNPEPLFRASSSTHLVLKIKFIGVAIGLSLLVAGAYLGGPLWALVGKIVGVLIMNIIGLIKGARLLKSQFLHLFVWKDMLFSFLLSILLSSILYGMAPLINVGAFWTLALSFSLYSVCYLILACRTNLIHQDEIYLIKRIFFRIPSPVSA